MLPCVRFSLLQWLHSSAGNLKLIILYSFKQFYGLSGEYLWYLLHFKLQRRRICHATIIPRDAARDHTAAHQRRLQLRPWTRWRRPWSHSPQTHGWSVCMLSSGAVQSTVKLPALCFTGSGLKSVLYWLLNASSMYCHCHRTFCQCQVTVDKTVFKCLSFTWHNTGG